MSADDSVGWGFGGSVADTTGAFTRAPDAGDPYDRDGDDGRSVGMFSVVLPPDGMLGNMPRDPSVRTSQRHTAAMNPGYAPAAAPVSKAVDTRFGAAMYNRFFGNVSRRNDIGVATGVGSGAGMGVGVGADAHRTAMTGIMNSERPVRSTLVGDPRPDWIFPLGAPTAKRTVRICIHRVVDAASLGATPKTMIDSGEAGAGVDASGAASMVTDMLPHGMQGRAATSQIMVIGHDALMAILDAKMREGAMREDWTIPESVRARYAVGDVGVGNEVFIHSIRVEDPTFTVRARTGSTTPVDVPPEVLEGTLGVRLAMHRVKDGVTHVTPLVPSPSEQMYDLSASEVGLSTINTAIGWGVDFTCAPFTLDGRLSAPAHSRLVHTTSEDYEEFLSHFVLASDRWFTPDFVDDIKEHTDSSGVRVPKSVSIRFSSAERLEMFTSVVGEPGVGNDQFKKPQYTDTTKYPNPGDEKAKDPTSFTMIVDFNTYTRFLELGEQFMSANGCHTAGDIMAHIGLGRAAQKALPMNSVVVVKFTIEMDVISLSSKEAASNASVHTGTLHSSSHTRYNQGWKDIPVDTGSSAAHVPVGRALRSRYMPAVAEGASERMSERSSAGSMDPREAHLTPPVAASASGSLAGSARRNRSNKPGAKVA